MGVRFSIPAVWSSCEALRKRFGDSAAALSEKALPAYPPTAYATRRNTQSGGFDVPFSVLRLYRVRAVALYAPGAPYPVAYAPLGEDLGASARKLGADLERALPEGQTRRSLPRALQSRQKAPPSLRTLCKAADALGGLEMELMT